MHALIRLSALLLFLVAAGCGQSGPLYIPGNPSAVEVDNAESQSDEEEDGTDNGAARP